MKRKIFSILFALVLVLTLSLVTAVPVAASPTFVLVGTAHGGPWTPGLLGPCFNVTKDYSGGTAYLRVEPFADTHGTYSYDGSLQTVNFYVDADNSDTTSMGDFMLEYWYSQGTARYTYHDGTSWVWGSVVSIGSLVLPSGMTVTWDDANFPAYVELGIPGTMIPTGVIGLMIYAVSHGVVTNYSTTPGPGYGSWDYATWADVTFAMKVTLCAGQHIDVGTVTVWNDDTDLYVKYETKDGWEMTETHLEVVTETTDFPTTKKGNPIPGHFTWSEEHDPPVTSHLEVVSLDSETDFYIAAHADVQKLSDPIVGTLASGAGTDSVLVIPESSTPDEPEEYPGPYTGTPTSSVSLEGTPNRYVGWPSITGAEWISESTSEPNNADEWRLFTRTLSLPSNATNFSGTLQIGKDNAFEAKLNGSTVGSDGEMYISPVDNGEWQYILTYAAAGSNLQLGDNTLEIMVRNYYWDGMPDEWRNYTGLIYKMDYEYQLLFTETAWGDGCDGSRFVPRGNWATYFAYHVVEVE